MKTGSWLDICNAAQDNPVQAEQKPSATQKYI